MDREALRRLSRDELIELVVRLSEMVAASGQQQERLAELDGRLAELQAEVERLSAPPKTSGNSSVPPSVGFKANRARASGAEAAAWPRRDQSSPAAAGRDRALSAEHVLRGVASRCRWRGSGGWGGARWSSCRRSGRWWSRPGSTPHGVGAVGTRTKGTYPAGLEPTRTFGPQIEALLGYFHERHHVSYERLVEVCRDVFGLTISEGGIDQALRRLAERARPTYEAIGAAGAGRSGDRLGRDRRASRRARPPGSGCSRRPRPATTSSCPAGTPR